MNLDRGSLDVVLPIPTVEIEVDVGEVLTFAMQQNDFPLLRSLRVANRTGAALSDVRVRISCTQDVFEPQTVMLGDLEVDAARRLPKVDLAFRSELLANRTEREVGQTVVEVFAGDRPLAEARTRLEVLSFNEWPGTSVFPEILAAFVTPNHPSIDKLLATARDHLGSATGNPSLAGYQDGGPGRVRSIVQAISKAFREAEIGYVAPPASYEQTGQKIRSADQVLDGRLGTCLDLSVVLASAFEQAGLNAVLVMCKGHAFVGVWLRDESFSEGTVDDRARVLKRVQLGEMVVLESTALLAGSGHDFAAACMSALKRLESPDDFLFALDIRSSRRNRVLPLPSRVSDGAAGFRVVSPSSDTRSSGDNPITIDLAVPDVRARSRPVRPRSDVKLELSDEAKSRLEGWKRKLLDMTLRNRLLNFRDTKKCVPLMTPNLATLEDGLADGRSYRLIGRPSALDGSVRDLGITERRTGEDAIATAVADHFGAGRLCAELSDKDLAGHLLEIYREARTTMEETGANTLYLALGTLAWNESGESELKRRAPIVLLPATLVRDPGTQKFDLKLSEEDARVNVTLLEMLRSEHGIDVSGLDVLPEDDSGIDIDAILLQFTDRIKDVKGWEVRRTAHLSLFSFAKFMMWADLEKRASAIAGSAVVREILERCARAHGDAPVDDGVLPDERKKEEHFLCPVDADSSQIAAIEAAMRGRTFVLQGPPGTGKSQTITNIVARAVAAGKRVLFVAEKMAALGVVHGRLEKLGLRALCLELHSSKASKAEVLGQLREAIELEGDSEPEGWAASVKQLAKAREELNAYASALHALRPSGETVYRVIGRMARLEGSPAVPMNLGTPERISKDELLRLRQIVDAVAQARLDVGDPRVHPLRAIGRRNWSFDLEATVRASASKLRSASLALQATLEAALREFGFQGVQSNDLSRSAIAWLTRLAKLVTSGRAPSESILSEPSWGELRKVLERVVEVGRKRDSERSELAKRYREPFLTLDHVALKTQLEHAERSKLIVRWWKSRGARKILASHCVGKLGSNQELVADLSVGAEVRDATKRLEADSALAGRMFGRLWNDAGGAWASLDTCIGFVESARFVLRDAVVVGKYSELESRRLALSALWAEADRFEKDTRGDLACRNLAEASDRFASEWKRAGDALHLLDSQIVGEECSGFLALVEVSLSAWEANTGHLVDWCAWRKTIGECPQELVGLVRAIEEEGLGAEAVVNAFEHSFGKAWLGAMFAAEPSLQEFAASKHDRRVEAFRVRDREVISGSGAAARAKARCGLPGFSGTSMNARSEIGILRAQLQLKKRHMPVRKLVQQLPTLLPRIKPCWLMSPLSVAQYLDPALPPFDIVIFDEASQIPPWDAIGALARGAEAVIVGDSKQLPPTSFFAHVDGVEGEDEGGSGVDLESVLDEGIAAGLPTLGLRWHYRSRHESLIAFSNHHYYDNKLHTFPSPDDRRRGLGVSLRYFPDGVYDRGNSKTNLVEARAIVAEIVRRLSSDAESRWSIGVVTFNSSQQNLIEDLLEDECRTRPELRKWLGSNVPESVFIKNLENVQGDERDVILFSICYGPDAARKPTMNFGPINQSGGERRLNVAITRARREVIVFSSIRAGDIDLNKSNKTGVVHLKTFLDYADRGPRALLEAAVPTGRDTESPFEDAVRSALRAKGWEVDCQVGCSGYRIDLAVKDPKSPGRYLLGIECDGAMYHSARSARDRDRLREQVLRGLGWKIHRVWSTDWMQSRSHAMARLEEAIRKAELAVPEPAEVVPPALNVALPTEPSKATLIPMAGPSKQERPLVSEYSAWRPGPADRDAERFYTGVGDAQLREDVEAIVRTEAPLTTEYLAERIASVWGIGRMTERFWGRMERVREELRGARRVFVEAGTVWSSADQAANYRTYRGATSGIERSLECVSVAELANAAEAVLKENIGLPRVELCREVGLLFGVQRLTGRAEELLGAGVDRLAARGGCVIEGDRVRVR